jgi:hypothetical protein
MFSDWVALMGVEPEGEAVTCIWSTVELGQLGTSPAVQTGGNSLSCHGPGGFFPDGQVSQIISRGLTSITVSVVAEDSAGEKSPPSSPVTVNLVLPLPVLQIQYPTSNTPIFQNQPFTVIGTARESTVISNANPDGIIHYCLTAPQRLGWAVGGYYSSDLGGWVVGYNDPKTVGNTCSAQLTIPSAGPNTINFFILTADGSDLMKDSKGNPIVAMLTVNVQPSQVIQTTTQAGPALVVTITTGVMQYAGTPPIGPSSAPIQLSGTATGGTPPYTVVWFAKYSWNGPQTVTIVTGSSKDLSYAWSVCPSLGSTAGSAYIFLKVTDANGVTGQAGPIEVNFNCEVAQSLPPFPGLGVTLASLLSLLFAVTAERLTPILHKGPRLRTTRTGFLNRWHSHVTL